MSQLIGAQNIVCTLPPFLKRGEVNLITFPRGGKFEKLKKRWKYHAGADLLERRGLALFSFTFFKFYNFYIKKLLYPLQSCVMLLNKKNFFFCHHNFMAKDHSKRSKNEPKNIP